MPRTLRHLGVLAAVMALLTASCTSGAPQTRKVHSSTGKASMAPTEAADSSAEPNSEVVAEAKRVRSKRDLTPVGDLVDGGHGIGVYYGLRRRDHQLFLRAIEVATGKVLWQQTAVPGEQFRLRPAVSDGEVAFVSSAGDRQGYPVSAAENEVRPVSFTGDAQGGSVSASVVDVRSGDVLTGPIRFTGEGSFQIEVCGRHRFCLDSGPWDSGVPVFGPGADAPSTPARSGWFYNRSNQVVGLKAGKEAWHVSGSAIWPFAGSSKFMLYPIGKAAGDGVHVIEGVRQVPARRAADIVTVGLSAADGHVLWKKVGFDALCDTITPSGDTLGRTVDTACQWTQETKPAAEATADDWTDVPLILDSFTDGTSPYDYVGYDRRDGAVKWRDGTFGLPAFGTRPMSTDGDTFTAVSTDDREVSSFWTLRVSDGTDNEELPDGSTSWIAEPVDVYGTEKEPSGKLVGQTRLTPVSVGGYEGLPSWPIPKGIGVHVGSVVAVADDEGISAYRAP